ncbi:MAG: hypothetical protein GY940_39095 [bacterium]|nr:hypothetical protein [bacterium]
MRKSILFLALLSMVIVMTSCQKGEEVTISKYFEAMKLNDKDTMSSMATEPIDIEFKEYEVVSVGEPVVEELLLPKYKQEVVDLGKKVKDQTDVAMEKRFEIDDLKDEMEETRRRTKKDELQKKIDEAELALKAEGQKVYDISNQIAAVKKKIEMEESLIKTSASVDRNYELWTGESHSVKAIVKITNPEGSSQDYVFLLKKYMMKLQDRPRNGRLVIVKIATVADFEKEQQATTEMEKTTSEEVTEEKPTEEKTTDN